MASPTAQSYAAGNGETWMEHALAEARAAAGRGEVPVGAVVVAPQGYIVARSGNRTRELADPTAHAEMLAVREACRSLGSERLLDCDLYVTLEPCPMCAAAISLARIRRLYYAASDPKSGGVEAGPRVFDHGTCHHRPDIYAGIGEQEAAELLRAFFSRLRKERLPPIANPRRGLEAAHSSIRVFVPPPDS